MASKVACRQQAMAKARERRSALDQDRAARDRRVEEATAQVLLQLQERAAAQEVVQAANAELGAVLRRLLDDEGIAAQGVGSLVELTVTQVRRLARAVPSGAPSPAGAWVVVDEGQNPPEVGGHPAAVPPLAGEQHSSVGVRRAHSSVGAVDH